MNIQPTGAPLPPQVNPVASNTPRDVKKTDETTGKTLDLSAPPQREQAPDRAQLEAATKIVREFVEPINSNLEFSLDDDTGRLVVKIVDRATKEVIRQMPSEEMLAIAKTLDNIKGLFVKQTA